MINNEEKISIIINKLDNLQKVIDSYIEYADVLQHKYSLDDVLLDCDAQKSYLLSELELLGGTWINTP